MKLQIETLTPIFSYGADPHVPEKKKEGKREHEGTPEIRPQSIRGQLRWWMEHLHGESAVKAIFGHAAGNEGTASRIIVRVTDIEGDKDTKKRSLPHKHWSSKTCYPPGTTFHLHCIERLGGLTLEQRGQLSETLEAWLTLGTLGGRGTRGAGSLQSLDNPPTVASWCQACTSLASKAGFPVYISKDPYPVNEALKIIADTLAEDAFQPHRQLGGIRPRKTSPLRLRVVRFTDREPDKVFIVALWCGGDTTLLEEAARKLDKSQKRLGRILLDANRIT